jgi:hypothetical protein
MIAARLSPGAISESSSSHLPPSEASKVAKPVMFPPGWLSPGTMPVATGSITSANTIGIVRVCRWSATVAGVEPARMMSGCRPTNSCASSYPIVVAAVPPKVDPQVAAIGPTQARKRLNERGDATLPLRIVFVAEHEHADAPHAVALLHVRRERPRRSSAAEKRDELAPANHSITSSARSRIDGGMARPSALAVLRFTTISNLVGNYREIARLRAARMRST